MLKRLREWWSRPVASGLVTICCMNCNWYTVKRIAKAHDDDVLHVDYCERCIKPTPTPASDDDQ